MHCTDVDQQMSSASSGTPANESATGISQEFGGMGLQDGQNVGHTSAATEMGEAQPGSSGSIEVRLRRGGATRLYAGKLHSDWRIVSSTGLATGTSRTVAPARPTIIQAARVFLTKYEHVIIETDVARVKTFFGVPTDTNGEQAHGAVASTSSGHTSGIALESMIQDAATSGQADPVTEPIVNILPASTNPGREVHMEHLVENASGTDNTNTVDEDMTQGGRQVLTETIGEEGSNRIHRD